MNYYFEFFTTGLKYKNSTSKVKIVGLSCHCEGHGAFVVLLVLALNVITGY